MVTDVTLTFLHFLPGEIINWVALDREQYSQHSLKVMVTDQGHPRLNATATVHILIADINDNAPQFTYLPASKELNVQVRTTRLHHNVMQLLMQSKAVLINYSYICAPNCTCFSITFSCCCLLMHQEMHLLL